MPDLYERRVSKKPPETGRSEVAKDRDRIVHSSAFRRLQGKSQIFGAHVSDFFRTRLTHSIECAQIGRAIARRITHEWETVVEDRDHLPDLVEAACLAHDLGHPPFGHNGERALRLRMEDRSHSLFEGNAQSFRLVTFLEPKTIGPVADDYDRWVGLDLTCTSLRAITKYPVVETDQMRNAEHPKFSVYRNSDELEYFDWLWDGTTLNAARTLATEIVDVADDIAYATHDFEDGVWSGMIPLYALFGEVDEEALEVLGVKVREKHPAATSNDVSEALFSLMVAAAWEADFDSEQLDWARRPFERTRQNVAYLKRLSAALIGVLIDSVVSDGRFISPSEALKLRMNVLTAMAWVWMIERSELATVQFGQRRLIEELFEAYFEDPLTLPRRQEVRGIEGALLPDKTWPQLARLICDHIAGMTDEYALAAHAAMFGGRPSFELRYAY